jgi:hypothetical protein
MVVDKKEDCHRGILPDTYDFAGEAIQATHTFYAPRKDPPATFTPESAQDNLTEKTIQG